MAARREERARPCGEARGVCARAAFIEATRHGGGFRDGFRAGQELYFLTRSCLCRSCSDGSLSLSAGWYAPRPCSETVKTRFFF
jgi:hypothetical protein